MTTTLQGREVLIQIATDVYMADGTAVTDPTFTALAQDNFNLSISKDQLDVTQTALDANSEIYKVFADGLRSGTGSISLVYDDNVSLIETLEDKAATENDSRIILRMFPNRKGTSYYQIEFRVSGFDMTAAVADKQMRTFNLQANSPLTRGP